VFNAQNVVPGSAPQLVTIACLESGLNIPPVVLGRAKSIVVSIFERIDVHIKFAGLKRAENDTAVIAIQFDSGVSRSFQSGALAYSLPYGRRGTLIHIFSDRVLKATSRELAGPYLGHVMAHEIAHVLQGINRHSDSGVMKPHWDGRDFYQMMFHSLDFTSQDKELVHAGLKRRTRNQ
jgi:hypothetical protein